MNTTALRLCRRDETGSRHWLFGDPAGRHLKVVRRARSGPGTGLAPWEKSAWDGARRGRLPGLHWHSGCCPGQSAFGWATAYVSPVAS